MAMYGQNIDIKMIEIEKQITLKQTMFCHSYLEDHNATRAYKAVYPECSESSAKTAGSRMLTKDNIRDYLEAFKRNIEKEAAITKAMVINEHKNITFSSIANLHDGWITRKDFNKLTDKEKACIQEITSTRMVNDDKGNVREQVKIKLYDKLKSLESISRMLGYNEPEKVDLTNHQQVVVFEIPDNGRN